MFAPSTYQLKIPALAATGLFLAACASSGQQAGGSNMATTKLPPANVKWSIYNADALPLAANAVSLASGASAAFKVTRTVSFLRGTLEVCFEGGFSLSLMLDKGRGFFV